MGEEKYIVYLHINNTNNKVYVGITHHTNPELRWRYGYKHNPHFTSAISKYGWDNFEHIILFKGLPKVTACREEQLLIKRYRNKDRCYNISDGGEATAQTESIRVKISNALRGKPKSDEHKRKCSIAVLGKHWNKNKEAVLQSVSTRKLKENYKTPTWLWSYNKSGSNNPFYGRKHSESTLAKKYKAVVQLDKNNNYMQEYKSIKDAANAVNISRTHLVSALKGRSKSAAGFIWKYKEDII